MKITHRAPFRNSESPAELYWVLCVCLGVPLLSVLSHESSTLCAPLPSCASSVSSRCWICHKFRSHRVHRVSHIDRAKGHNTPTSTNVYGLRSQGTLCDGDTVHCFGGIVPVFRAVDIRYSRVRGHSATVTYHPLINFRLTGDEVNRRRILSSWTLHFAAKETSVSYMTVCH